MDGFRAGERVGTSGAASPYAVGQLINHPSRGVQPNVDWQEFRWDVDEDLPANRLHRGLWYIDPATGEPVDMPSRPAPDGRSRIPLPGVAIVALRDLAVGEELHMNYRINPPYPPWYSPVEPQQEGPARPASVGRGTAGEAARLARVLQEKGHLTSVDIAGYQQTAPAKRLVAFTGNSDGSPTTSWCPDCDRAMPAILASAASLDLPLLVVGVGGRDDWKLDARGGEHPLRARDGLALTGVPTMLLTGDGGAEIARLGPELEEERDVAAMRAAIDAKVRAALP